MTQEMCPANGQPKSPKSIEPPALRVVGIGASAGGLTALKKLFANLPEEPGACFVVVVHLAADHESHLAPLLQAHSGIPVQQVTGATQLEANRVYVIPPGANIDAIDTHLRLSDLEPQRRRRAPIDHFFRTLAEAHGEQAVGVILTGTGSDGTQGLRRIRERGGLTIVQSPDEADYDAMPRSAIAAGVADLVLRLDQIPAHILQTRQVPAEQADGALQEIFARVRAATGHDFTPYKRSTILRRVRRRMQVHRVQNIADYLKLLDEQDQEAALLFEDLLITVTEFFRDDQVFEHLQTRVIPSLFEGKQPADHLRVWSIGCATGEEAYSLAMLLLEESARRKIKPKHVQLFASDLCEKAIRKAREGVYPESIEADVSPQRLSRFFERENGSYRIRKQVRERIIFATHDILQDPPFSHLQLISCRNLLIYLQRDAQKHLTSLLHYALEEDGYLLVGTSEAIETDLFVCEDKKHGLYRRRSVPARKPLFSTFPLATGQTPSHRVPASRVKLPASYGAMHEKVVELYAPPSVLIDPDGEVVHYSTRAGRFLRMPGGTPTNNVFHLVVEPLRLELRAAIHAARDQGAAQRTRPIAVTLASETHQVILRVHPVDQPQMQGFVLVIFDELTDADEPTPPTTQTTSDRGARNLEVQLEQANKQMQALIEEHDAGQERMQAYNEELVSTNEELRSTMEELESSKEEMQSMNEELTTLNQENLHKVEELDQLSNDLQNLLTATHIATVFVDSELCVLRFTPSLAELLNVRETDRGRPLVELARGLDYEHLLEDLRCVLDRLVPVEREVQSQAGQWYMARLQPYRTDDDRIRGVVVTFIDITERKEVEEQIRKAKELAEDVVDAIRTPMLVLAGDLRVRSANEAFYEYFDLQQADIKGVLLYELKTGPWGLPRLRELLEHVLPDHASFDDFEVEYPADGPDSRWLAMSARQITHLQLILLAVDDVTERKQVRRTLEQSRDELGRQVAARTSLLERQARRLQALVREVVSAEQRERTRMAAVMHDELQQLLVSVKMQLSTAQRKNRDKEVTRSLDRAFQHLDEAIDATRALVRDLVPQALYKEGLVPALRWLGQELERRHGLHVRIENAGPKPEPALGVEASTLLFESTREMLFNVVKHADVDEATVEVRQDGDWLVVTVSDEGVGFDVETKFSRQEKSEFSISSRVDRIEALGGIWSVDSSPGQGTRVQARLPLELKPTRT